MIVKLTYTRQAWSGTYYARTDTHSFAIDKIANDLWDLRIWTLPTRNLISYDSARTMHDAKVAAQKFADQA
jgi:hypothetical protein